MIKDIIKYTDEQPDEEIHRVKSGRVLRIGVSVPMELGWPHSLNWWMCSPTQKLSEPHTWGQVVGKS